MANSKAINFDDVLLNDEPMGFTEVSQSTKNQTAEDRSVLDLVDEPSKDMSMILDHQDNDVSMVEDPISVFNLPEQQQLQPSPEEMEVSSPTPIDQLEEKPMEFYDLDNALSPTLGGFFDFDDEVVSYPAISDSDVDEYVNECYRLVREASNIEQFVEILANEPTQKATKDPNNITYKMMTDEQQRILEDFQNSNQCWSKKKDRKELAQRLGMESYKVYKWLWEQKKKNESVKNK